jgi:hypothetical protein
MKTRRVKMSEEFKKDDTERQPGVSEPVEQPVEETTMPEAPKAPRAQPQATHPKRPEGIVLLAIYHFLVAIPGIIIGILILIIPVPAVAMSVNDVVGLTAALTGLALAILLTGGLGIVYLIAGIGLLYMKNWARWLAIALAVLSLLFIPIGTVLGAIVLVYLFNEPVRQLFEPAG